MQRLAGGKYQGGWRQTRPRAMEVALTLCQPTAHHHTSLAICGGMVPYSGRWLSSKSRSLASPRQGERLARTRVHSALSGCPGQHLDMGGFMCRWRRQSRSGASRTGPAHAGSRAQQLAPESRQTRTRGVMLLKVIASKGERCNHGQEVGEAGRFRFVDVPADRGQICLVLHRAPHMILLGTHSGAR